MTSESFCALCNLAAQLEWCRGITRLRRKGAEECGWMDMTGCSYLHDADIASLQAVIERREKEDRKCLDKAAKHFVEVYLANDFKSHED